MMSIQKEITMTGTNDVGTGQTNRGNGLGQDLGLHYAGISEPARLGEFGVEESAARLRRFEYVHRRLVFLEAGHLTQRALWELKVALGRHLYQDAEAVDALRQRIGDDLRQNARVLGRDPDQRLALLLDELLQARSDEELLVGLYEVVKPALLSAERAYVQTTQPIVDEPAIRLLRSIITDQEEQVAWGERAVRVLIDERGKRGEVAEFGTKLQELLQAAGGITGTEPGATQTAGRRWRSTVPFVVPPSTIRDERFPSTVLYRHGSPDQAPPDDEVRQRVVRMMRVRQEEMNVAELVAAVIWTKQDQPWELTFDLARHEWDEMRHCMMGQVALETEGINWMAYPQFTGDYDINATHLPDTQYAWLHAIESALMSKTGKRAEYEFCRDEAKHPLMTQFQDFDWADEVKHVHIGREWAPEMHDGDARKAKAAGERAVDEFFDVVGEETREKTGEFVDPTWLRREAG